jgi:hypothetical protein
MAVRRGAEEAEQASNFASFDKLHFLKVEDKASVILRFITDTHDRVGGMMTVDMHQGVPTKSKPGDFKGENWPTAMPAVCRKDKAFKEQFGGECYICDVIKPKNPKMKKATGRVWAWAVLREAVIGDGTPEKGGPEKQGKTVGYVDAIRTVKKKVDGSDTEVEVEEKALIVVNQGYKNFFSALVGHASVYGTALDRDYVVQRKGTGTATDYNLVPLDPITLRDGRAFDLRDDDLMKERYGRTATEFDAALEAIINERTGDDYYGMWFMEGWTRPGSTGDAEGASAPDSSEPDEDQMKALKDRIEGYQPGADGAPADKPAEEPAQEAPVAAGASTGMQSYD